MNLSVSQVFCSPDVSQRFLGSDGLLASDRPSVPGCEFRVSHLERRGDVYGCLAGDASSNTSYEMFDVVIVLHRCLGFLAKTPMHPS